MLSTTTVSPLPSEGQQSDQLRPGGVPDGGLVGQDLVQNLGHRVGVSRPVAW